MRSILYMTMVLALAGCNQNRSEMDNFYKVYGDGIEDMGAALKKISTHKIYFGHQSVGYDMLSGLEQWEEETGVQFHKTETRDFSNADGPKLIHFRVGENRDPYSKIEDFSTMVQQIPEDEPSLAFFKFCYIDFHHSADVDAIFKVYKKKMLSLRDSCGNCKIILCTVPFTSLQKGPKALVKKILGMPLNGARENIKRNAFSEKVRAELGDQFPVFDLAKVESTLPDGSTETFKYSGKYYPRLPQDYTRDKGHLNSFGAKIVAYNLIAFLNEEMDQLNKRTEN